MATLTLNAGPAMTVTAITGIENGTVTLSGSGFSSYVTPPTGVRVVSDTVIAVPVDRIFRYA